MRRSYLKWRKRVRQAKGFTLVELIIVIAVIAILLGIALPRLRGMIEEGNTAKAAAELSVLQAAVESYYVHNKNTYPATLGKLTTAKPLLIADIPDDPFVAGGVDYSYGQSASTLFYVIFSKGVDGAGGSSVADSGTVTAGADDIYVSNGNPGHGGF